MPFISVGMVLSYVVRWWSHLGVLCVDLKKGDERRNCDCEYVLKTTIHKCVCHFFLSCLVLSCLVLSYLVLSCLVCCLALSLGLFSLLPCYFYCPFSLVPPPYHVFADISVGGCERICSYTPPQISSI